MVRLKGAKWFAYYSDIRNVFLLLFVTIIILPSLESCKSPTSPVTYRLSLSVTDVSCTEAWLNLSINNAPLPTNITIMKNGNPFVSFNLSSKDTAIYDSTLLPNKTYSYQAEYGKGFVTEKSEIISAKTMDTTSNNYSWQLYTLGNVIGASSMLYDVAIINDTSIWAVGEINIQDSIGMFNALHWDGKNWNPIRLKFFQPGSVGDSVIGDGRSIVANSGKDIWVVASTIFHYDGIHWTAFYNTGAEGANRIWSNGNGSTWFVGQNGNIVLSANGNWQKIESGTNQDLYDIYSNDGKTIYASGGNFQNYSGILLRGNNSGFQTLEEGKNIGDPNLLFHPYFDGIAKTVWSSNTESLYFGGNGLYIYKNGTISEDKTLIGNLEGENINGDHFGFISQIRGTANNDIMMVGERNTIRHFNGVRWQQLGMPYDQSSDFTWLSISMKNDLAVVVGYTISNAIIMVLKRQ